MFINQTKTKRFILARIAELRPHLPLTRVSATVYEKLEQVVRDRIEAEIMSHPTRGKTFYMD